MHSSAIPPSTLYPAFLTERQSVSCLLYTSYGDAAQKENNWGYDWLPKWDQTYDVIKYFNMMDEGKVTGYFCQGFNPVASFPDKNKVVSCLSKLKYMVVIDPLAVSYTHLPLCPTQPQKISILIIPR